MKKEKGMIKSEDENVLDKVNGGSAQGDDVEEVKAVRQVGVNHKDNPGGNEEVLRR